MSNNKIESVELEVIKSKQQAQVVILNLLEREEKLSDLEYKSEALKKDSKMFLKQSKKIKRKFCTNKYTAKFILCFMILVIIYFILSLSCGIDFSHCKLN